MKVVTFSHTKARCIEESNISGHSIQITWGIFTDNPDAHLRGETTWGNPESQRWWLTVGGLRLRIAYKISVSRSSKFSKKRTTPMGWERPFWYQNPKDMGTLFETENLKRLSPIEFIRMRIGKVAFKFIDIHSKFQLATSNSWFVYRLSRRYPCLFI